MVKKSTYLMIVLACILVSISCVKFSTNTVKVGNTSGNINNGARYVEYKGWIYYTEPDTTISFHGSEAINPFGGFWKMKPDYSQRQQIANEDAESLFVVDSKIYTKSGFVYDTVTSSYTQAEWAKQVSAEYNYAILIVDNTLYFGSQAINLDGTNLRVFAEDSTVVRIDIYKGWIYFNDPNLDKRSLCRIKPDGTKKTVVASGIADNFVIVGSKLYYANTEDNETLYVLDLNKGTSKKLADVPVMKLNYYDGSLYYISHENRSDNTLSEIYRINTDGSDNKRIVATNEWLYEFSIIDGWLYYGGLPSETDSTHLRISLSTGEIEEMKYDLKVAPTVSNNQDYIKGNSKMSVAAEKDGWLYFSKLTADLDRGIYRIKPDGSALTKISDEIAYSLMIAEDWIYFSNFNHNIWLFRMHLDGSGLEIVVSKPAPNAIIKDEWIYAGNSLGSFRVRTDGTGYVQLSDRALFHISGSNIYYSYSGGGNNNSAGIFKMNLDGGSKVRLYTEYSYIFDVSDEWIYFKNMDEFGRSDGFTYRMKQDGSSLSVIDKTESYSVMVPFQDWYYAMSSDRRSIFRMKANGTQKSKIANIASEFETIDIINDKIIISTFDYETSKFSIVSFDLDGTHEMKLYP